MIRTLMLGVVLLTAVMFSEGCAQTRYWNADKTAPRPPNARNNDYSACQREWGNKGREEKATLKKGAWVNECMSKKGWIVDHVSQVESIGKSILFGILKAIFRF